MCLTRHPKMSREEFKDYWMNQHGPFFMSNADAMGAKKYVQSHTLNTPLNEGLRSSRGMQAELLHWAKKRFNGPLVFASGNKLGPYLASRSVACSELKPS